MGHKRHFRHDLEGRRERADISFFMLERWVQGAVVPHFADAPVLARLLGVGKQWAGSPSVFPCWAGARLVPWWGIHLLQITWAGLPVCPLPPAAHPSFTAAALLTSDSGIRFQKWTHRLLNQLPFAWGQIPMINPSVDSLSLIKSFYSK